MMQRTHSQPRENVARRSRFYLIRPLLHARRARPFTEQYDTALGT